MDNNIFRINFKKLAQLLLPTFLRKPVITAFVNAFVQPLERLNEQFTLFRVSKEQQMSYNSQVCYLRKMLNDLFDPVQRRITIKQYPQRIPLILYKREEEKPVMFGTHLLPRRDAVHYSIEFTVNIPTSLQGRENEIRANLNYYKLATTNYIIKYF
jgi:hypothetical protein